ncbi:MAG: SLC13 family permease [Thalassobius sp.]|nr:SLC13 family permease [Thalassovita sp.]
MILNDLQTLVPFDISKLIVTIVLVFIIFGLIKEIIRPSLVFFGGVVILIFFGIIHPSDFMKGYSNQSIATVVLLVLITAALRKNFAVEHFFDRVFQGTNTKKGFLIKMMTYVAVLSSFLNNTPVVAVMTPYVFNWCKKRGFSPSKLLIPLSFATILGGMITIIGTSTNLVLNGFIVDNNLPAFGFTDFLFPGILVAVTGIIYLYFFGYKLLPRHKIFSDEELIQSPDYMIEVRVAMTSRFVGGTISEAGLKKLEGAYLVEIHRNGVVLSDFNDHELILPEDSLFFMGKPEQIIQLANGNSGLSLPNHGHNLELVEAVIPANSAISGKTVKDANFKDEYKAELVAIHRNGEKLEGKLTEKKLAQGDLLLLSVDDAFLKSSKPSDDLYIISKLKNGNINLPSPKKLRWFTACLILFLSGAIFGLYSFFSALLFIMSSLLMLNLFTFKEISQEVDIDLVILLVCALTFSNALIQTGTADMIASSFIKLFLPFGNIALLIAIFALTVFLTSFITNVAAVSIVFPIALAISTDLGLEGTPFFLAIAFGASAAFMTPVSYQTNWMVYGPGGYNAKDYLRVGLPLVLIYSFTCLSFICLRYNLF